MAHILFGDMSSAGLHTLRAALRLGHEVTLLLGRSERHYVVDDAFRAVLGQVGTVVEVEESADVGELVPAIAAAHRRLPIDAVISQCDPMMEALALACEQLGLRYTPALGIRNARDKDRARELVAAAGLASAGHAVADTPGAAVAAADRIGYPVVVKPVNGLDSRFASRADGPDGVARAAAEILAAGRDPGLPARLRGQLARGVLVEEYLAGELVSAEIGVLDGVAHRFLVCGRSRGRDNDCVEIGAVLPADLPAADADRCFDYAERVCAALGLDFGVFHVEIMLTPRGPVLVEVNPRVMGGVMTRLYDLLVGRDFCEYVIDVHLGRRPDVVPLTTTRTITARRVMPAEDGVLPPRADLAALLAEDTGIVNFEDFGVAPGARVRAQQVLCRYAVTGETWAEAMDRADDLVPRFADALGVDVIAPARAARR